MTFISIQWCVFTFREQKIESGSLSLLQPQPLWLWWWIWDYYFLQQTHFLSFPRAPMNVSHFFLTIPSCFDTYSRELDKELKKNGKEELPRLPNLGVFRPTGRCLPLGCTAATVLPLASLHSRPHWLDTVCFIAAALDRQLEKLIAFNSMQTETISSSLLDLSMNALISFLNYSSK